jgi:hypothetical protein
VGELNQFFTKMINFVGVVLLRQMPVGLFDFLVALKRK